MSLIVQKYGGTSLGDAQKIKNVAKRVAETYRNENKVVVTVSAMGHTTDELLNLSGQISDQPSERELSQLLSTGEQISIALLTLALNSLNVPALSLTGRQAGILTEERHANARIVDINTKRVLSALNENKVVIVAGFQGVNSKGDTTTLGRGGSDTTAVALAAALDADYCEIYTDVDGVYTVDPRIVPAASKIDVISYDEMLELASLGAQVLHPRAVECAKEYGVDLHVCSSFTKSMGTKVTGVENMEKGAVVKGIACDSNQTKFAILEVPDKPGMAFKIFNALAEAEVSVDLIVQSVHKNGVNDILFTVKRDDALKVRNILDPLCLEIGAKKVICQQKVAKISVVGAAMTDNAGVAAKMFEALSLKNINIEIISTSEIRISCLIDENRLEDAANSIHEIFGLG